MKLTDVYINEVLLPKFWEVVKNDTIIDEVVGTKLNDLLTISKDLIFDKFNIDLNDKTYFIAGSSLLYLYPNLRKAFNLSDEIGDLDIVIPNRKNWEYAGVGELFDYNGIYRPKEDDRIEVFNIWQPSKAGVEYADVNVRSTNEIMSDVVNINGVNFMSIDDVIDYKTKLNRDKEQGFVELVDNYIESDSADRQKFLTKIVKLIGIKQTKEFLGKL